MSHWHLSTCGCSTAAATDDDHVCVALKHNSTPVVVVVENGDARQVGRHAAGRLDLLAGREVHLVNYPLGTNGRVLHPFADYIFVGTRENQFIW